MSGGELIQPLACSAGAGPLSGRCLVSTGPEIDDGSDRAATSTLTERNDHERGRGEQVTARPACRCGAPRALRLDGRHSLNLRGRNMPRFVGSPGTTLVGCGGTDAEGSRRIMARRDTPVLMPSDVSQRVGPFDRFAGWSSQIASRAAFFTFCVLLVVVWAPTFFCSATSTPGSSSSTRSRRS